MALVQNTLEHTISLTYGTIDGLATRNIDASLPYELDLIEAGVLIVVDPDLPPPAVEPLLDVPRQVFVGTTQPPDLPLGAVWLQPDGELLTIWVKT